MHKFLRLFIWFGILVATISLVNWLFTDKSWIQGMADGLIGLVCATIMGAVLIWWVPRTKARWEKDDREQQERHMNDSPA